MNKYAALSLVGLLAACNTTGENTIGNKIDNKIDTFNHEVNSNIPAACLMINNAHNDFSVVASTGLIDSKVVIAEKVAFISTDIICADPAASVATLNAISTLTNAYAVIIYAQANALNNVALQKLVKPKS